MDRRTFLGTIGAVSFAGCGASSNSQTTAPPTATLTDTPTPTSTPTKTPTPTETSTPFEPRPRIVTVNLVSEWEEYGDMFENSISKVVVGEPATIAFRHQTKVHNGTFHIFEQVEIFNDESRVSVDQYEDEQLVDGSGVESWEHALTFSTADWSSGTHTAEVFIRDEVTGKVSDPETWDFEVVSE